jgi:hypothetical protein
MSATFTALRPRHLAWLPAALLAAYAIVAATGMSLTPASHAATATATTTVNATVLPEVHLNFGACGTIVGSDATLATGSLATTDEDISLGTCVLTFGSNNNGTNGASLWVESARTSGGKTFCTAAVPGACAAPEMADANTAGITAAAFMALDAGATGAFALKPNAAGTCPGAGADWASTTYYGVLSDTSAALGTQICDTNSTADGTMTMDFRANPGPSQAAGSYTGKVLFTAQAV